MTNISISQLKINPSAALLSAEDFPVAIQKRNKVAGYLLGKDIFEKMVLFMEDIEDKKAIKSTDTDDFSDFEEFAKELGV